MLYVKHFVNVSAQCHMHYLNFTEKFFVYMKQF